MCRLIDKLILYTYSTHTASVLDNDLKEKLQNKSLTVTVIYLQIFSVVES